MLLLLMQRAVFVCGLVRQSAEATGLMNDALKFCCNQMGVRQTIGLKISPNATSPAVCGLFRPVILVPQGLGSSLGISSLRVVLMHELAHIKRGDLWVNLLQTVLQIAYFYNPLLWLANWVIRRVREQAVDEAVQVALGERAQQYPETLLNVARLAFERPALSLRLIGVVESKSALTSRIKRMLTQPIPKTAKLGIIGSLVVLLLAAVLLPMAKAEKTGEQTTKNSESANAPFSAKLDNGVAVELVGICEYPPESKKWWRPDGKELAETFSVKETGTISAGGKPYALLIKTSGPNDTTGSFDIEDSRGVNFLKVVDSQGLKIKGMLGLKVFIDENRSETSVKATFAAGPWTMNIGYNGVGVMSTAKAGYGVTFASPQQTDKGVTLVVSDDFIDCDRQVVAIDDNNEVHKGLHSMGGAGKIHQTTAVFSDITLDKIKEFQIQARPLKRVIFRNVSLKPGVKTDVKVEVEGSQAKAENVQPVISAAEFADPNRTNNEASMKVVVKDGKIVEKQVSPLSVTAPIGKKVVGIGPGWDRLQRVIGDNYRGSIGGYSDDEQKCGEYFEQVLSWAKPGDTFVMMFAFDEEKFGHSQMVPQKYQDLLPKPWLEIKERIGRGEVVELKGKACGFDTIVLAAPTLDQLDELIKSTELLQPFKTPAVKVEPEGLRIYEVNRMVAEFSEKEDLSTPEAAYASINRVSASGDQAGWQRVSVKELGENLAKESKSGKNKVEPEWAKVLMNAKIIEVQICDGNTAVVFAELPQAFSAKPIQKPIDIRHLKLDDGKWLNTGNDRVWTIEEARAQFDKLCGTTAGAINEQSRTLHQ
jgi:hypothetical protein